MSRIYISADVDLDDILSEIGEKRLVEAVKDHGYLVSKHTPIAVPPDDAMAEVHEALIDGRHDDALALVERIRFPKWKSADACLADYERGRQAHD